MPLVISIIYSRVERIDTDGLYLDVSFIIIIIKVHRQIELDMERNRRDEKRWNK